MHLLWIAAAIFIVVWIVGFSLAEARVPAATASIGGSGSAIKRVRSIWKIDPLQGVDSPRT